MRRHEALTDSDKRAGLIAKRTPGRMHLGDFNTRNYDLCMTITVTKAAARE